MSPQRTCAADNVVPNEAVEAGRSPGYDALNAVGREAP